ncbi:MAG: protein adenylyltransferase SelO family protein, partial [Psychrosphaera sp.]|nr:protein adenylyltransferase SelO family protein [Psychrosphaera sp.]
ANQPKIAQWNLYQLANAIVPLIEESEGLEALLQDFTQYYQHNWLNILASKVGFAQYNDETDNALLEELLALFPLVETDMTIFYRHLANLKREETYNDEDLLAVICDAYYQPQTLDEQYQARMIKWLRSYQARIAALDVDDEQRKARMNKVNPKYVLRNYIAQQAIDKAHEGDYAMVNELLDVMRKPYDDQPQFEHYAAKRPEWARVKAGCSMLSCSS